MGMHEDRMKAMLYQTPEFIPISVGILPAAWIKYREELDAMVARHPVIFGPHKAGDRDYDAVSGQYVQGEHVDAWGCVWSNIHHGCDAIVTKHPLPTREHVRRMKPPAPGAGIPHGFMWLRLADLRGFEEIMVDFAEEPPELRMLLDIVRDYNIGELKPILENPPDIAYFGDDLGMQTALAISPEKWRKFMKPCFAAIYEPVRAAGSYIYMHTDGHIIPIVQDLKDCGVNVVNPQIRANGLDRLVEVCKGVICVDLDLDRQLFPFCKPSDIDAHVEEAVAKLGAPEGGLWLKAELGPDVPMDTAEAICTALEKHRSYWS